MARSKRTSGSDELPLVYKHPTETNPMRPDVGTQAQFKKPRPRQQYRYDSSLSPALDWDGQNAAREQGEHEIAEIQEALAAVLQKLTQTAPGDVQAVYAEAQALVARASESTRRLRALSRPFLNWSGKAEHLSFDVPTLPLFVHERLSTQAILDTLKSHRKDKQQSFLDDLFADPRHPVREQVLRAYEFQDKWVNRMILGDSLVVMNSLLQYEGMSGKVQMIYMDPPYGVKFGSNFQPFVRDRGVGHNDDDDMTREPEMVQAYRDTWELGLHSYLTYLRDRLLLAKELLAESGSIFVQISDDNVHHVRELMDEVFGVDNFSALITFRTTGMLATRHLGTNSDYLLWYARNLGDMKYNQLYVDKTFRDDVGGRYTRVELADGTRRFLTPEEREDPTRLPRGARIYRHDNLTSQGYSPNTTVDFQFEGQIFHPGKNSHWKTDSDGLTNLAKARRLAAPTPNSLTYVRYLDDFPVAEISNVWTDTQTGAFTDPKTYVVQTNTKVIQRCMLMSTEPGDLVLDPTCGSGSTAYVAEQWGRRWVTIDVSRVPLALARQRVLTATFPWYELRDPERGPAGGFKYERKQNDRGEEIGGIVPHIMLSNIAKGEVPEQAVLFDRPEENKGITRVSGPFTFEATIPTPIDLGADRDVEPEDRADFVARMIEILRRSPVIRLPRNQTLKLKAIRPPARTLSLSAEAIVDGTDEPVAIVFGPESGAVSERFVNDAASEANTKHYKHLYVIGFAIEPHARDYIESAEQVAGIPATYIQATPDVLMGDLLKNMRSSEIFSVCGLPDVDVEPLKPAKKGDPSRFRVRLAKVYSFDPVTMKEESMAGSDVPAWFLDTDYNDLCFRVRQAFFPRTSAWDNLKKHLKVVYEESVFDHLSGDTSAPFEAGETGRIAVKVIDDRGNELLVVKNLPGGRK